MCIYSQLKRKCVQPPPPQGVNGTANVPKLHASCRIDISKEIFCNYFINLSNSILCVI